MQLDNDNLVNSTFITDNCYFNRSLKKRWTLRIFNCWKW